jgi:hypothetical protein
MAEFCPECGKKIPPYVKYCTGCGIALDAVIKRDPDKKPERKIPVEILIVLVMGFFFAVWIFFPLMTLFVMSMDSPGTGDSGVGTYHPPAIAPIPSTTLAVTPANLKEQNISIVKKIVVDYHRTHTYSKADMFVCADMAIDVWNMVETQGVHAIIKAGAVDKDITEIRDVNHAWVMAEVAKDEWIALETTGGYLVCPIPVTCLQNNSRYYTGWNYASPKEFKEYLDKIKHPCPDGYVLGNDQKCHEACGGNTYCSEGTVCVNGRCRSCPTGYILGQDILCHQECPAGSGRYCITGTCGADGLCH